MRALPSSALDALAEVLPAAAEPRHLHSVPTPTREHTPASPEVIAAWQAWEARIEEYLTACVKPKNQKTASTRLRKFGFWMVTGTLPAKVSGVLCFDLDAAVGPRTRGDSIDEVTTHLLTRYNTRCKVRCHAVGPARRLPHLARFYAWHTAGTDTLVAGYRWLVFFCARVSLRRLSREVEIDDVDLSEATIVWRHGVLPGASRGTEKHRSTHVQPIPPALVQVLTHYLTYVRPHLAAPSSRLLVSPGAQNPDKTVEPGFIRRLLPKLAGDQISGSHTVTRWTNTYALRVANHQRGGIVALTGLQGRGRFSSAHRGYGHLMASDNSTHIDDVFGDHALWQ